MCSANVDVYTHFWTNTNDNTFSDFNINRQCRDFDAILNWQEKTSVGAYDLAQVRRPEEYGDVYRMTREFKEVRHWYDTHEDDGSDGGEIA